MSEWLKVLKIGTRVRVKGKKNIDGQIIDWLTDDKKNMVGYLVKSDKGDPTLIMLALDDNFEVLRT